MFAYLWFAYYIVCIVTAKSIAIEEETFRAHLHRKEFNH